MNMQQLMMQAQKMQRELAKKQAALDEKVFEVVSAGGAVKVSIKGNRTIEKIEIDKDAIDPDDKEMLEDLIKVALNEALSIVNKANEALTASMGAGMRMPGF